MNFIPFFFFCTQMLDIRHDNLSHFIGATADPPNICIVSEFYSRGSLQVSVQYRTVAFSLLSDNILGLLIWFFV